MLQLKTWWNSLFQVGDDEVKYSIIVIDKNFDNDSKEKTINVKYAKKFLGIKTWHYAKGPYDPLEFSSQELALEHIRKLDELNKKQINKTTKEIKF